MDIKRRFRHWRDVLWSSFLAVLGAIYGVLGVLTFLRGEFVKNPDYRDKAIVDLLPAWGWEVWVILALAILLVVTLEGSFRVNQSQEGKIDSLRFIKVTHDDLNKLAEYRRDGINRQAQGPNVTAETLPMFAGAHEKWRERTVAFLQQRFQEHQWDRFATVGTHLGHMYAGMDDAGYQTLMARWDMEIHRLDDIRAETLAMLNATKGL